MLVHVYYSNKEERIEEEPFKLHLSSGVKIKYATCIKKEHPCCYHEEDYVLLKELAVLRSYKHEEELSVWKDAAERIKRILGFKEAS